MEENSHRERKGPAHLVKSTAKSKAEAETKKMVSAQIQTSPVPAPAKETQTVVPNPQKGKKGVCDTNFTSEDSGHQDPGHIEGRGLQFVRTPTCHNDADLRHCTGSATQHNAANRTGQERNESHSQCHEIPDQDQRRQDEETEQNVN